MLYEKAVQSASHWMTKKMLDRTIPCACPICRKHVNNAGLICADCWKGLPFIEAPCCESCGQSVIGTQMQICADCWNTPRSWRKGMATVNYEGLGRQLILRFKNGGAELYAPALAHIMYTRALPIFREVDMIAAMPLHWRRMLVRGYNQAGSLATQLSQLSRIPYDRHILKRVKYTKKQGKGRDFSERFNNIEKAIIVPDRYQHRVQGQRILIVDDVITSGASLHNCAEALLKAGARDVNVLVFARAGISS